MGKNIFFKQDLISFISVSLHNEYAFPYCLRRKSFHSLNNIPHFQFPNSKSITKFALQTHFRASNAQQNYSP